MPKKKVDGKKISNCKLFLNLRDSSNNCIKATQAHLKKQFVSLKKRFYKEKSRIGNLTPSSLCARSHSYCITLIRLVIELIVGAAIGPRTVQNVLKILSEHVDIATPARSTIGQWFAIIGLYIYNLPIKSADDWIWLIDLSIPVGVRKLCIILGIRKSDLKKGHINVRHKDMTIIHMEAVETVNAQVILKQLNKAKDKVGYAPAHLASDGGTEVKKAKGVFCKENPSTCPSLDISHMCANIMKGLLKDDKRWNEFTTFITNCKAHIAQTNIGFLCPPKQRTKARFLGLSRTTKWAFKILNSEGMGDLSADEFVKCDQYLAGIHKFEKDNVKWNEAFEILDEIQKEVKCKGLTRGTQDGAIKATSQIVEELIAKKTTMLEYARAATVQVINFLKEEELQLKEGETILASTDILESYFGLWKYIAPEDALCGVTSIVLGLPVYSRRLTDDLIKAALEGVDWGDPTEWAKENLGPSMFARRIATLKLNKTGSGDEIAVNF